MSPLGDTGVWVTRVNIQPDAEFLYRIYLDDSYIPDPLCKAKLEGFGPNSVGRMPEYEPINTKEYRPDIPHGLIESFEVKGKNYEEPWRIYMYLPPGYEQSGSQRYPVLYAHDGGAALEHCHLDRMVDNLIAEGEIEPLILCCIPANDRFYTYWLDDQPYVDFMVNELVPLIDSRYRTLADKKGRAVSGESLGGRIASQIASQHPDTFEICIAQSSYFSDNSPVLERIRTKKLPIRFFVDCGIFERDIGKSPVNDGDLIRQNREFHAMLKASGYDVTYREWPGGHNWLSWAKGMDTALRLYWQKKS
jgi:enterochelin esterase family protein